MNDSSNQFNLAYAVLIGVPINYQLLVFTFQCVTIFCWFLCTLWDERIGFANDFLHKLAHVKVSVYPRLFEIHIIHTNTQLRRVFNSSHLGFLPTFVASPSLMPLILSTWIYISERSNQSLPDCHIHPGYKSAI